MVLSLGCEKNPELSQNFPTSPALPLKPLCLGLHSVLSASYLQACLCITAIPSTGPYFLACEQVLGIFNARVLVFPLNLA